jgi:chromosome segregation ATPase
MSPELAETTLEKLRLERALEEALEKVRVLKGNLSNSHKREEVLTEHKTNLTDEVEQQTWEIKRYEDITLSIPDQIEDAIDAKEWALEAQNEKLVQTIEVHETNLTKIPVLKDRLKDCHEDFSTLTARLEEEQDGRAAAVALAEERAGMIRNCTLASATLHTRLATANEGLQQAGIQHEVDQAAKATCAKEKDDVALALYSARNNAATLNATVSDQKGSIEVCTAAKERLQGQLATLSETNSGLTAERDEFKKLLEYHFNGTAEEAAAAAPFPSVVFSNASDTNTTNTTNITAANSTNSTNATEEGQDSNVDVDAVELAMGQALDDAPAVDMGATPFQ